MSDVDTILAGASTQDEDLASLGHARVKVLGLGGGGSNAVNRMIELGLTGVEFVAANTDAQALQGSLAPVRLQLGPRVTRGLGAGGDPKIGAAAAMESSREIARALAGADMVFITCGMGGGTGTGAAAVAAEIAREVGAVVIAIVTMPFAFEMSRRSRNAVEGVRQLQPHAHTLITVPNDRLLQVVPRELSLEVAFRLADDVLRQGVQGIAELITQAGLVNVDFAHVRELMMLGGGALMSIGLGEGHKMARTAVRQALHHPLVGIDSLEQASGVLLHFTGGDDLTLFEIAEAVEELRESLSPEADIVFGATTEKAMTGRTQVILIVTGIGGRPVPAAVEAEEAADTGEPAAVLHASSPADQNLDLPTFLRRRVVLGAAGGSG
jgi:cell division protein FtsZ